MRKLFAALCVLVFGVGVVMAEEFNARITKIDGNKISVNKAKKGETADDVVLTAAKGVKVHKGKLNKDTKKVEAGDALEGGLSAIKLGKGGSFARITTNDDNKVTDIIIFGGGGKKKKTDN